MANKTFHAGETWPPLVTTLVDQDGPIDLSTADSVMVHMAGPSGTLTGLMFIDPDQSTYRGKVTYFWQTGDTDAPGTYQVLFYVVWSPTQTTKVPNSGYKTVVIEPTI